MFITKFVYDLTGRPEPTIDQLDDEIDRLLLKKSAERPTYLVSQDHVDQVSAIDLEAISFWLKRSFEPALITMLLGFDDNYHKAKVELSKMETFNSYVEKLFRRFFVQRQATQRVKELCFDDINEPNLESMIKELRRTLNLLSKHLESVNPDFKTLQDTDQYTTADIMLYNYLKRIFVGNYKDFGLRSHLKLCDPLINFMRRYANKNAYVIDIVNEDPLADDGGESSLLADMTIPAIFAIGLIVFYLWREGK